MKFLTNFLFLLFFTLLSCTEKKPLIDEEKFRTVVIYIAADNNLNQEAYKNIAQMEKAFEIENSNLIIYTKLPNTAPALYRIPSIKESKNGRIKIKEYPNHNSSDPHTLKTVMEDVKEIFPAKTYGLILWSHATGWIPPGTGNIKLKSFGEDNGDQMDIKDLDYALPNDLDFICFDACSMASLEVLYEIKNKAKYFIASPGEVIANGMPYDKTINYFFSQDKSGYATLAQKYYEHYNSMLGNYQSATISVIDASLLSTIAQETKSVLLNQTPKYSDLNRSKIQRMDFDRTSNPLVAFDFLDFINQNYSNITSLQSSIEQAVIFKANTPKFNGFPIITNSGLTCYIPISDNEELVHNYYRTLKWYQDSGFSRLF